MKIKPFLLLGPEIGEKKEFITKQLKQIKEKGEVSDVKKFYPGEKDLREILGEISNGSLFSSLRVFILEQTEEYNRANVINPLVEMLKNPPEDVLLILTSDRNSVDRKITAAISKENKKIFWEMFEGAKKSWIQNYFRKNKVNIHHEALEELLGMVENNTTEIRIACDTLLFYFSEGDLITSEDIDRILYHSKEENVFSLFDKIAHRDLEGALEVFGKIRLSMQSEVVQLFAGLLWQIKLLLSLSILKDRGFSEHEGCGELKITGKRRQKLYWSALQKYRTGELQRAITLIAQYDKETRSLRKEMQDRIMELFLLRLMSYQKA
ncbi:MAG: DNA polymerase III subunit delta [Spirochaetaceae bacterium]|jgi:DNA polymerase-3 subunit delta|nr:DNA polymerase III subunit delta [Spirochaetaceae bacterium]